MRLVIVEDHCLMREALRVICEREPDCEVAGEAETGRAAVELIPRVRPDLAVLNWRLPDLNGAEVLARVRLTLPHLRVLVASARLDECTIWNVERAAVHGFVDLIANPITAFHAAVRAVAGGRTYFAATYQAARRALWNDPRCAAKVLSDTEQRVLGLIGEGCTNGEIAARLGISPSTSQTHRRNIAHKLGIAGTPKLATFAIRRGFARV